MTRSAYRGRCGHQLGWMSPERQYRIVYLEKTCSSHPAQWIGDLDDGRSVYIRYRFGIFSVGIGSSLNRAIDSSMNYPAYRRYTDDPYGAELETSELPLVLPDWLLLNPSIVVA